MKGWFLLRWEEGVAKLRGHTRRKAPSELSYELVLEDGRWFTMPDDPRETPTFAILWRAGDKDQRLELAKSCFNGKRGHTIQIDPGEFGNDTKEAYVFLRGIWTGRVKVEEDDKGFVISTKMGTFRFVPRSGVKNQWRVRMEKKTELSKDVPVWFSKSTAVEVLEEENVWKPGTDPKLEFIKRDGYWEIRNVPIAKPGLWNGIPIREDFLKRLVDNWQLLRKHLYVPLKLGHNGKLVEAARYDKTGEPALGWVKELYYDEDDGMLRCTFTRVPGKVVEAIKRGAYTGVSMEVDPDFNGRMDVLVGVALLGADIPAITDLPRLIQLYSRDARTVNYEFPISAFGGERMSETVDRKDEARVEQEQVQSDPLQQLLGIHPATVLAFAKDGGDKGDIKELVEWLHKERRYPHVLAEELVKLLPNPSMEQIKLMPEYDKPMWKARLEKLDERADKPEKCEDVVKELEEFLEMFEDELDDDFKKEVKRVLEKAKKNMPHIEVEDLEEGYPEAKEDYPKAEATVKEPGPEEKYPEEGVKAEDRAKLAKEAEKVEELAKKGLEVLNEASERQEFQSKLQRMRQALASKAEEAIEAKVRYFAAQGLPSQVTTRLREILRELDPVLTPKPDRRKILDAVMSIIQEQPLQLQTFSRLTPPDVNLEPDLSSVILKHAPKSRMRR